MDRTFSRQLAASREELSQSGLPRRRREPVTYRTLWALGFQLRPPHYAEFLQLVLHDLLTWSCYGAVILLIALLEGGAGTVSFIYFALITPLIAILSGAIRFIHYRRLASRYSLSTWDAFG